MANGTRPRTAVVLLLLPPILVVGLMARAVRARVLESRPFEMNLVEAPNAWVPFTARVTITKPGSPQVVGRYYRSSNGSNRLETGPSDSDVRVVHITNNTDGLGYLYNRNGWVSWKLERIGLQPTQFVRNLEWSDYPHKLALKRGESGSLTASEGFKAYLVVGRGISKLRVPELNLFAVVRQRIDGRHESYTNIELAEPDDVMFSPPAGTHVTFKGQMKLTHGPQ
jgi:hypothetical protein